MTMLTRVSRSLAGQAPAEEGDAIPVTLAQTVTPDVPVIPEAPATISQEGAATDPANPVVPRDDQERIEIVEDEDEDEVEIILNNTAQLVLSDVRKREDDDMGGGGSRKSIYTAKKAPINFFAHEPTFGGWLNSLKKEMTEEEAIEVVVEALTQKHLVLATFPGSRLDPKALSFLKVSVGNVLGASPPPISIHPATAWAYVECENNDQKLKLLSAKIVWNVVAKSFVVFRAPRIRPYAHKAVEVRGLRSQEHCDVAEAALLEDGRHAGVEIKARYPDRWVADNKERVIWVFKHTVETYTFPPTLRAPVSGDRPNYETKFEFAKAPVCAICAGEDHHLFVCPYKEESHRRKMGKNRGQGAK